METEKSPAADTVFCGIFLFVYFPKGNTDIIRAVDPAHVGEFPLDLTAPDSYNIIVRMFSPERRNGCMIYLFEKPDAYPDARFESRLWQIPKWRRDKAMQYTHTEDRKRSVLAFLLLQLALREEYGITEIPEFSYGEFGKPFLPDDRVRFSLSHCRDAVVCTVSDHPVGIDAECVVPYDPVLARRVCSPKEAVMLEHSKDPALDFIRQWTVKEAISKYEGKGLSMTFEEIDPSLYRTETLVLPGTDTVLSVCFSKAGDSCAEYSAVIRYVSADEL